MEGTVKRTEALWALKREWKLLRDLQDLQEEQMDLIEPEIVPVELLNKRRDLILELSAIDWTLGTWIEQIKQGEEEVPDHIIIELGETNQEIAELATEIVSI